MPERRGLSKEYMDEFKKSMKGTSKKRSAPKAKIQRIFYIAIPGSPSSTEPVRAFTSTQAKQKYIIHYRLSRTKVDDLISKSENKVSDATRRKKPVM